MPVPPVVGDPEKKETINESNYTHMRKKLAEAAQMNGHIRPARRRWKGVQRDESLWRRLRRTARRAGGANGNLQHSRV